MTAYELDPDVAGDFGDDTVGDQSVLPPHLERLTYELVLPRPNDLIETVRTYLVTARLADALTAAGVTGVRFADATVRKAEQLELLHPEIPVAEWRWMQVTGTAHQDDAWRSPDGALRVSERLLAVLGRFDVSRLGVTEVQ